MHKKNNFDAEDEKEKRKLEENKYKLKEIKRRE